MCPVAVELGADFPLHSYGLLVAFAFLIALVLVGREGPRVGISIEEVADFGFWALVSALAGSRILFLVVHFRRYRDACLGPEHDCLGALRFWEGGLVFYGGLLGAVLVSIWFARRRRIPFLVLADTAAPSIALGHVFGRLGCFAAGCCYGKPSHGLFATAFPRPSVAWSEWVRSSGMPARISQTPPLHPTQLYEAFFELSLFFLLLVLRSRKRFHGNVLLAYLVAYPIGRSALEVLRADTDRGFLLRWSWPALSRALGLPPADAVLLSTAQALSLGVAAAALVLLALARRRAGRAGAGPVVTVAR